MHIQKGPILIQKIVDSNGILVMRPPLRLLSEAEQARGARIPKRLGGGWDMSGRPAGTVYVRESRESEQCQAGTEKKLSAERSERSRDS